MWRKLRGLRKSSKKAEVEESAAKARGAALEEKSEAELALEYALASREMLKSGGDGGVDRRGSMAASLAELRRRKKVGVGAESVMDMPEMGALDDDEKDDVDALQERVAAAVASAGDREAEDLKMAQKLQQTLDAEADLALALRLQEDEVARGGGASADGGVAIGIPAAEAYQRDAGVVETIRAELAEIGEDLRFVEAADCPLDREECDAIAAELRGRRNELMMALPADLRVIMSEVLGTVHGGAGDAQLSQEESDFLLALKLQAEG